MTVPFVETPGLEVKSLPVQTLQRAPVFPLFYKGFRFLVRWKSDETEPTTTEKVPE